MILTGWLLWVVLVAVLIVGMVIGLFLSRFTLKNYFAKNPPITEEMVESMMAGMGQTPNKKRVKQIMKKIQSK